MTADLTFENFWQKDAGETGKQLLSFWKEHAPALEEERAVQRLNQLVWVVRYQSGEIAGEATAEKVFIKQLRNYFYNVRVMHAPLKYPGLMAKLITDTRDFLESIHTRDDENRCIGIITLVESDALKKKLTKAILPAGHLVYIGNTAKGSHIRVSYFGGSVVR